MLQLNASAQVGTYNAYTADRGRGHLPQRAEITFDLYRCHRDDFLRLTGREYWEAWDKYQPKAEEPCPPVGRAARGCAQRDRLPARAAASAADEQPLPPGIYFLQARRHLRPHEQRPPRQILVRTDLNVTLKSADTEALAWVTDLKSGQPVAGATVRFTDNGGN